ncbi:MAG: acyltransferase [Bacteroidetes bacterium]|nr:MAG: acyltransferase [Bacteroidota bacterium]
MISPEIYDDLRPYNDEEVSEVFARVINKPQFLVVMKYIWPEKTEAELLEIGAGIQSTKDLQKQIMQPGIRRIIENSSRGLTCSGFDQLNKETAYVFISNHRDIFLDAAFLQVLLFELGIPTTEVAFGSNLGAIDMFVDVGKSNKMFTAYRGGSTRKEIYENTLNFSRYVRHTISNVNHSVWLTQRNGRTKDGLDKTEERVLKILNMSADNTLDGFAELNIIPMTISYEYDPCDLLKTRELYESKDREYIKSPGEDLKSVISGVLDFKGHIHIALGKPLTAELEHISVQGDSEQIKCITEILDVEIIHNLRKWPVNYIAADLLADSSERASSYTNEERKSFEEYVETKVDQLEGDGVELRKMFLRIYANPVLNNELQHV